ncbi:MAG: hypothetical protein DYG86_13985, partial [Chloroflexi bacterium CFX2]|nr:hypothetical protein [Chloroflexi bacterium CFX2]
AGPLFDRMKSFLTGGDINPFIGAVGISAFPMAGRLDARSANDEDSNNNILMPALGATTAGQRGRVPQEGFSSKARTRYPTWERVIETAVPSCYNDFEEIGVG